VQRDRAAEYGSDTSTKFKHLFQGTKFTHKWEKVKNMHNYDTEDFEAKPTDADF